MPTVAICAQRGGCGKTTTTQALAQAYEDAHALDRPKPKCLAVDLDPQASLTDVLGHENPEEGMLDAMLGDMPMANAIQQVSAGIDMAPAGQSLISADVTLLRQEGSGALLAKTLSTVQDNYGLTLIDTPPSLGVLTVAALMAADHAVIVATPERLSMAGLKATMETIGTVQASHALNVLGVIVTRCNQRHRIDRAVLDALTITADKYGIPVLGVISESVGVRECQGYQDPLSPALTATQDYRQVYKAIAEKAGC